LDGLDAASDTWKEFRDNAESIKNLTNAEINRAKEMRLTLTSEQVLSMIDRLLNVVTTAIEANVHDMVVQGRLMRTIVGETPSSCACCRTKKRKGSDVNTIGVEKRFGSLTLLSVC